MLIAAVFVMVSLAALLAVVVRGAVHAVTPRSAERPVESRRSRHSAFIDTTARQTSCHSI